MLKITYLTQNSIQLLSVEMFSGNNNNGQLNVSISCNILLLAST
jgi:hypothetical protein